MPVIPPEVLSALQSLGITEPAHVRWQRRDSWPLKRIRSYYFCDCDKPPVRVDLVSTHLAGRDIFIGQCAKCRTVYWRDAVRE
jgi:hypothetical protein